MAAADGDEICRVSGEVAKPIGGRAAHELQ